MHRKPATYPRRRIRRVIGRTAMAIALAFGPAAAGAGSLDQTVARVIERATAPDDRGAQFIATDRLPIFCTTDADCEDKAAAFGCAESDGPHAFLCHGPTFRAALARHAAKRAARDDRRRTRRVVRAAKRAWLES